MRRLLIILLVVAAPIALVLIYLHKRGSAVLSAAAALTQPGSAVPISTDVATDNAAGETTPRTGAGLVLPPQISNSGGVGLNGQNFASTSSANANAAGAAQVAATVKAIANGGTVDSNFTGSAAIAQAEKNAAGLNPTLHSNGAVTADQQDAIDNAIANPVYATVSNYSYAGNAPLTTIQAGLKQVPVVGSLAAGAVGVLNSVGNALGALGLGSSTVNIALVAAENATAHGKEPSTARQTGTISDL